MPVTKKVVVKRKTALSNSTVQKRKRSASLKVQRRRRQLILFYNTAKDFTIDKAANALGVSRRTVHYDLVFLKQNELLTLRKTATFPFGPAESTNKFYSRFMKVHNKPN
jgi:DeoR/GlpR family transcriptional regulator of sugar metabolism